MESTVRAWEITKYGGPDVLKPTTLSLATPRNGEVLIRIRASAVTRADNLMRSGTPKFARLFLGWSKPKAGLSGTCFAGDVLAVGSQVDQFQPGDAVFGEAGLRFGANATHIMIDADASLMQKPDTLSYEDAAVMSDGALTSWHFLTRVVSVKSGDKVLVIGGSGSLGSAAVQFAAALGAEVTASTSGRNAELVADLGATRVVDYTADDPLAGQERYDVVFDTLGVASFSAAKAVLVKGGRYICPVLSLRLLRDMLFSRLFGTKRALFAAAGLEKPEMHRTELAEILALVREDRFAPLMDRTFPLDDLVEAHQYVETGRKRGNVVVVS